MQLFIGYGYNPRDAWVEELVFPLVETLGWDVVHGKATYGSELAPELKTMLLSSDAMIGFLTRRDPIGEVWSTHRWVIEELACGFGQLPVVEVREEGVDTQNGMLAGMQRIQYRQSERDKCLVQIAQALNRIREKIQHRVFRLEPAEFTTVFRSLLRKPGLRCTYRMMRRNLESEFRNASISPVAGGLQMLVDGLRPTDLIQVCVTYGDESWISDYEPVDSIRLRLARE